MSAPNTTISWGTRYKVTNGGAATLFAATSGELQSAYDAVDLTDSECFGKRLRGPGVYEAEITLRGNIATDVSPHSAPLNITEGTYVATIQIYFNGIANTPDTLTNVFVDRFRRTSGPNLSEPNHFELHGYAGNYTPGS